MREAATQAPDDVAAAPEAAASVARNASVLAAATIVSRVAAFGLAVVLGRKLGTAQYGRYGFAGALATVLAPVADIGLTAYLTREVARARSEAEAALGTMLRAKAALAAGVAVLTAGAVVALGTGTELTAVVLLVLLAALADGVSFFVFGYFRGRERMGLEGALTAGTSIARSVVGIAIALVTGRLVPVLVWILAVSLAQLAFALVRLRRAHQPAAGHDQAGAAARGRVEWRTVAAIGAFSILTMIYTRVDTVLVGLIEDDRAVGLYSAAYTLMLGLQIVPWMIATALIPVFARAHASDRALFRSSWDEGIRAVLVVSLPCSLLVSLLGARIMAGIFGVRFGAAGTALAILVWCGPLAAFNTIVFGVLRGARREAWLTGTAALGVVLNVGLNAWAIPTFGISGAATMTVVTEVLVCGLLGGYAVRRGVVPLPRLPYVALALALVATAAVAALGRGLPLVVLLALALGAYVVVALATGAVRRSDVELLRRVAASRRR